MSNTIALREWLQVIDDEYLRTFIKEGGASVKFAVVPDERKPDLYAEAERRCRELGCAFIKLDAASIRAHMPQDIFFALAEQVDWRLLARRMILKLAEDRGYDITGIDPRVEENVFDSIAEADGLEPQFVLREIRREVQNQISKDTRMTRDFRVCMTWLGLEENARGEYHGGPLLDWLTGRNTRISPVRPFSIVTTINRTTARYFIESALYWIRRVGYAGTVILFDNSRVTVASRAAVARNPEGDRRYYTKAMTMEHYELLREFVDSADRLSGALLVVVSNSKFLDDSKRGRGYGIYEALQTRVMDDVRDRNRVNPVGSLVRLS